MAKYTRYVATDFGPPSEAEIVAPTYYTQEAGETTANYVADPAPVHDRPKRRKNTALWVAAPIALVAVTGVALWAASSPDETGERTSEPAAEATLASAPAPTDPADELAMTEPTVPVDVAEAEPIPVSSPTPAPTTPTPPTPSTCASCARCCMPRRPSACRSRCARCCWRRSRCGWRLPSWSTPAQGGLSSRCPGPCSRRLAR